MYHCLCGLRFFRNVSIDNRTETIKKRRAGRYGHPQTAETKAKIRESIINRGGQAA
jgi:hypothetical protein